MKTWQRILWFTIGLLTGIFWSALAYAEPRQNGERFKIGVEATVTNSVETEQLPVMGPHPYPASEIVVTDEGWFHVYNPDDGFYTVTVSDGNFTVNY